MFPTCVLSCIIIMNIQVRLYSHCVACFHNSVLFPLTFRALLIVGEKLVDVQSTFTLWIMHLLTYLFRGAESFLRN